MIEARALAARTEEEYKAQLAEKSKQLDIVQVNVRAGCRILERYADAFDIDPPGALGGVAGIAGRDTEHAVSISSAVGHQIRRGRWQDGPCLHG